MKAETLRDLVQKRGRVVIEFGDEEIDDYPEKGMRAEVTKVVRNDDDTWLMYVDFS